MADTASLSSCFATLHARVRNSLPIGILAFNIKFMILMALFSS